MAVYEIIASVLLIVATILVVGTVVSLWRAPDALTRANLMGPTVGLAVPLIIVAKLVVPHCLLWRVDYRLGGLVLPGPFHLWRCGY